MEADITSQPARPSADPEPMYDAFAPYYDLWTTMASGTQHDIGFYVAQAETLARDSVIVELGVGTGRVALAVAATGRRVTGVDNSPAMLERARANARAMGVDHLIELERSEFLAWSPPTAAADLVYCPYHTLGHVLAAADRRALFEKVYGALKPGGRFAFAIHGSAFLANMPHGGLADREVLPFKRLGDLDVDGACVTVGHREIFDPIDLIVRTEVCSVARAAGQVVRERSWTFTAAVPERREIEGFAQDLGFEIQHQSGAFDRQVEMIDEQVWVLRKPFARVLTG